MLKRIILIASLAILGAIFFIKHYQSDKIVSPLFPQPYWKIRSIDTMKYSRDLAREKLTDSSFNSVIEEQVKNIADTGASHIAIATPYDNEFVPMLKRWVKYARDYKLKVWFRGNFSGWEEWFDYKAISRQQHLQATEKFIIGNPDLFEDHDLFSPCPECENGGPGDPRVTGDVANYRQFLIDEHIVAQNAFKKIGKSVDTRMNSMNYDVALLVMDPVTTVQLGGVVAIDHYVKSPEQLNKDITAIARKSEGVVFLGEFGAPIPDIHGKMTEDQQAKWVRESLELVKDNPEVIGLSYWVNVGGSTEIWNESGYARPAVEVLKSFYSYLSTP